MSNLIHTWSDIELEGIVGNRTSSSLHEGSLEITFTVPFQLVNNFSMITIQETLHKTYCKQINHICSRMRSLQSLGPVMVSLNWTVLGTWIGSCQDIMLSQGIAMYIYTLFQNGWTDRAQICGTSHDPREGVWMVWIEKIACKKSFFQNPRNRLKSNNLKVKIEDGREEP